MLLFFQLAKLFTLKSMARHCMLIAQKKKSVCGTAIKAMDVILTKLREAKKQQNVD